MGMRGDYNSKFYMFLRDAERRLLRETLEAVDWNDTAAAALLGVSHSLIWNRCRMLGGVKEGEPRREPYNHDEAVASLKQRRSTRKPRDAKHRDERPSTQEPNHGDDQAADVSDGEAVRPDDQQDRASDQTAIAE